MQLLGAPAARGGGEGGAALVKALCGALRGLVAADDNKSRFTDAGGPAAVVDVMRMYPAVASVQEVALGCLAAAILRNPEGAIAAVEAGAASAAVDACDAHPKAAGVARQLCLFARNAVCRTPETREAVLQAGVESKLREAQTAFPGKCKDVAHAALRDLAL